MSVIVSCIEIHISSTSAGFSRQRELPSMSCCNSSEPGHAGQEREYESHARSRQTFEPPKSEYCGERPPWPVNHRPGPSFSVPLQSETPAPSAAGSIRVRTPPPRRSSTLVRAPAIEQFGRCLRHPSGSGLPSKRYRIDIRRFRLWPRASQVKPPLENEMRSIGVVVVGDERRPNALFTSTTVRHARHAVSNQAFSMTISVGAAATWCEAVMARLRPRQPSCLNAVIASAQRRLADARRRRVPVSSRAEARVYPPVRACPRGTTQFSTAGRRTGGTGQGQVGGPASPRPVGQACCARSPTREDRGRA